MTGGTVYTFFVNLITMKKVLTMSHGSYNVHIQGMNINYNKNISLISNKFIVIFFFTVTHPH